MKLHASLSFLGATLLLSGAATAQNCANTSVGFTPLNDLGAGLYQGAEGGLYPGGTNERPTAHEIGGMQQALQIVPRDAAGDPDPSGQVGFIALGMSNTRRHFNEFVPLAMSDPLRDASVVVVNTAQGGQAAEDVDDPRAPYWEFVDQRLTQAGLTPEQVQVAWFLQANRSPSAAFPGHAENLRDQFRTIVQIARDRYPNLRLCYVACRIYAGYATSQLNPEPWSYEQGFSNKWLIEDQIGGDAGLNYRPGQGPVEAPWLSWGPYMWADGLVPRSDGLIWECSDLAPDGTHPSEQGALKVASALLDFVQTDVTTACWYLAEPGPASYGTAKETSANTLPAAGAVGETSVSAGSFLLTLSDGVPNKAGLALTSLAPGNAPFFGGRRYLAAPFQRLPIGSTDAQGAMQYTISVTPVMVGTSAFYQFFTRDPQHPDGFGASNSDALKVVFFD